MNTTKTPVQPWPTTVALRVQVAVLLLITLPLWWLISYTHITVPGFAMALCHGTVAAAVTAVRLPSAPWWTLLQAVFPMAVVIGITIPLSPSVWLGAFVVLWLVNRNTLHERIPLYCSGRLVPQALEGILPCGSFRFVDLGCGLGGVLARLRQTYPQSHFEGVESAPLPWLIAWLRLLRYRNCRVRWGNFWTISLAEYQVVYCFLSPEPMPRLWSKVCAELRPGACLISNTFAIPQAPPPDNILHPPGSSGPLYVWRMTAAPCGCGC